MELKVGLGVQLLLKDSSGVDSLICAHYNTLHNLLAKMVSQEQVVPSVQYLYYLPMVFFLFECRIPRLFVEVGQEEK